MAATPGRASKQRKKTPPTKKTTSAKKPTRLSATQLAAGSSTQRLKSLSRESLLLRKQIRSVQPQIPGAFRLFGSSFLVLKRHWKLFAGVTLIYAVLNILLVHGIGSNGSLENLKSELNQSLTGSSKQTTGGFTLLVYLIGGSSSSSSASTDAGLYQAFLIILVSLIVIWCLRQVYNQQRPRIRDGFYQGTYPLVPFILVLLVVFIQLIPFVIGAFLYSTVQANSIAVNFIESAISLIVFLLLALVSLFMLSSSLFALYIVTLPDMTPLKALRSARELVRHRRFTVIRKLLFLPLSLFIIVCVIMLPVILVLTPIAEWLYFILTMLALPVIHSYMYVFYRELLPHE